MDQVMFGVLGFLIGLAVLYGVVRLALTPRKSWRAPPSGNIDDPLKYWLNGPDQDLLH